MPPSTRGARALAVSLVLLALLGSGLVVPAPARADDVQVAQARVDRLQSLVQQTTRQLTAGTRQWESDLTKLRRVRLDLANTQHRIGRTEAVVRASQAHVALIARELYMNPTPGALGMAFTHGPDDILQAMQLEGALDRVAGSDGQVMLHARTAKLRLQNQQVLAEQLTDQARLLVARSAATMQALQALAQSTADQLVAAQNALQKARAAKEAREAAARRARAARARFAGGPACTGRSTAGQQNGNLDPASLCPLWRAPGEMLRADAAAAFNKMSQYHAATVGSPLCVTDSYRSYSDQVRLYREKPGLAAVPGTSEHGWGKAVDFCGGVQNSGSAASAWMRANAGRFGWFHPDWAKDSGSRPEAWHWEFGG